MRVSVGLGLLALLTLVSATDSYAAGMYCGNDLVTEGMTKLEVLSKCGEPNLKDVDSVNTAGSAVRGAFRATTSAVEVWQYNCGAGRFNKSLYFDGGKLAKIEDGKTYGSGPERCA
jgi:hypothetical protein